MSNSSTDPAGVPEGMLEVGRITKAHGLRGDVVVFLVTDRPERSRAGAVFHTASGRLVINECRPHQDRFVVRFDGINHRDQAESLRGLVLFAEPLEDDDELWVHELVGATVRSADGVERGTVVEVQANPAADLLVLDDGHLVPVVFVVGGPVEEDGRRVVTVDTPDGLFDL